MQIAICPICGSNQIKSLLGKMTFKTPQGEITIPRVPRQRCSNCGEQFFDHESNKILDRYRGKRPKTYKYAAPTMPLGIGEDSGGKKYGRRKSTS